MPRSEITIPTPDGDCPATLHVPDGGGPAPAVIFYADAGGVRETMRVMADRLAASGYLTLLPDFYHRSGDWASGTTVGTTGYRRSTLEFRGVGEP
jgi:carboxymethylenebutenolidase